MEGEYFWIKTCHDEFSKTENTKILLLYRSRNNSLMLTISEFYDLIK